MVEYSINASMSNNIKFETDEDKQRRWLNEYRDELCKSQMSYVDYIKDTVSMSKDNYIKELEYVNTVYNQMVLMLCFMPMNHGVSTNSILQTMGFYVGCCVFSKSFRENMSGVVCDMISPFIYEKANANPNSKWAKRKAFIDAFDTTEHKTALTPESLSIMRIAFCEQAYDDMRKPNADVIQVLKDYQLAEEKLNKQALKNGFTPEILNDCSKHLVYGMILQDATKAKYFKELAYGDVNWKDGSYVYQDDSTFSCFFTPRPPESVNALRGKLADALFHDFEDIQTFDELTSSKVKNRIRKSNEFFSKMMYDDNSVDGVRSMYSDVLLVDSDDISWVTDYHGNNPYMADGYNLSYDDFVDNMSNSYYDVSYDKIYRQPEGIVAIGRWLNQHLEYNPAEYQRMANDLYINPPKDMTGDEIDANVKNCLAQRDIWKSKISSLLSGLDYNSDEIVKTKVTNKVNDVSYQRLVMLQSQFSSVLGYDESVDGIHDDYVFM